MLKHDTPEELLSLVTSVLNKQYTAQNAKTSFLGKLYSQRNDWRKYLSKLEDPGRYYDEKTHSFTKLATADTLSKAVRIPTGSANR